AMTAVPLRSGGPANAIPGTASALAPTTRVRRFIIRSPHRTEHACNERSIVSRNDLAVREVKERRLKSPPEQRDRSTLTLLVESLQDRANPTKTDSGRHACRPIGSDRLHAAGWPMYRPQIDVASRKTNSTRPDLFHGRASRPITRRFIAGSIC